MNCFGRLAIIAALTGILACCSYSNAEKQEFIKEAGKLPDIVCSEASCEGQERILIDEAKQATRGLTREGVDVGFSDLVFTSGYGKSTPTVCYNAIFARDGGVQSFPMVYDSINKKANFSPHDQSEIWRNNCNVDEEMRQQAQTYRRELELEGAELE